MTTRLAPGQYEDQAIEAAKRGEYAAAADLYELAAGASLGHSRARGYRHAAEYYRAKIRTQQYLEAVASHTPAGYYMTTAGDEDDTDSDAFSRCACDLCGTSRAGSRHPAAAIRPGEVSIPYLVCEDCLSYLANGDLPEDWQP